MEDHEFFLYQFFTIINPRYSVPSYIIPDATEYIFRRTFQNNKRMYIGDCRDVLCLPRVPRYAVQHENVALREIHTVQKKRDNLFREREMFVLKKEAALKNTMDEIELHGRIRSGTIPI